MMGSEARSRAKEMGCIITSTGTLISLWQVDRSASAVSIKLMMVLYLASLQETF